MNNIDLIAEYRKIRTASESICAPLEIEDYVIQPIVDVSPPKWHLAHTSWFFETFVLKPHLDGYTVFDPDFSYVFNSYYDSIGDRIIRTDRGNLSRPTVKRVYQYRRHVDAAMERLLHECPLTNELTGLITLGLNHEQQHQELLFTDIKYILGHNPLLPSYDVGYSAPSSPGPIANEWIDIGGGQYEIGHEGAGFCWDNELTRHKVYVNSFSISARLVTNKEFLDFILDGGYQKFGFWHAQGWDWVKTNHIRYPLYWYRRERDWLTYGLRGLEPLDPNDPVCHVSYFEACAFANWKGMRLPTEAEWEVAAPKISWGRRWEWTGSAYLPYPGYRQAPGALGEYNGKFMVNQQVLRGGSDVTPVGHSRITYRNYFPTHVRWQFTGIRLVK